MAKNKPSQRNVELLQKARDKVGKSQAMFFVDYQGLTHQQLEEARRELRNNNSEMAVVKNTLMNIALKEKNVDAEEKLEGAHATLFSYEDPVRTAKILAAFYKKYQLPKIKFGVFNGALIDEKTINQLATLPSREVLLGKLVGILKSPLNNLVYNLNYNTVRLVMVLKAIEKQKQASS